MRVDLDNIAKKAIVIISFLVSLNSIGIASYQEALALYEAKKYDESLKIIAVELDVKRDMEKNSPNYDLRFLAGHNHWKLGNLQAAIGHFRRCSEIKKESPDPMIDLSLLMLDYKRYGDANFFALGALKIAETPAAYYVLGKSAMRTGNFQKAKEYFEKAISLDPELGISYNSLGMVLMELKKYSEANTAFSAALATMPDSTEVLNNIAMNLEKTGRFDEALKYMSRAYEKNPDNSVIKINMNRLKEKIAGAKKG